VLKLPRYYDYFNTHLYQGGQNMCRVRLQGGAFLEGRGGFRFRVGHQGASDKSVKTHVGVGYRPMVGMKH
jgi:hypothetical protein